MRAKSFGDDWPSHELRDCEKLQEARFCRDEGVTRVGMDSVQKIGLLVVMGSEKDVVDDSLERLSWRSRQRSTIVSKEAGAYSVQLVWIFFHRLSIENLPVVFTHVQILVLVFCEHYLLLIIAQL